MLVCFCLFWWILLLGARADHLLDIPYWAVFMPLWVWKLTVFLGWFVGLIVWLRQRHSYVHSELNTYSVDDPVFPFIQAMSVSALFSLLLCCTEILLCLNLSIPTLDLAYLTVLTPLLLVGLFGIFGFFFLMIDSRSFAWWHRRRLDRRRLRGRSSPGTGVRDANGDPYDPNFVTPRPRRVCTFTLELCIAANLLQLLFLIARLDHWIRSKWVVTFIPTFILLGMKFLFCTVGFIVALIRFFTACFIQMDQRRLPIYYYASHLFIDFLLCTSITLLALRLDGHLAPIQCSYILVSSPVLLSLVIYATGAFCLGPGNPWWFGLNRNVLLALFEACPSLQLCANTSVSAAELWKRTNSNQQRQQQRHRQQHLRAGQNAGGGPHPNSVQPTGLTMSGLYSNISDDCRVVVIPAGCGTEYQATSGISTSPSFTSSQNRTAQTSPVAWVQRSCLSRDHRIDPEARSEPFGWCDGCIPLTRAPGDLTTDATSATAILCNRSLQQSVPKLSPSQGLRINTSLSPGQTENVRFPD